MKLKYIFLKLIIFSFFLMTCVKVNAEATTNNFKMVDIYFSETETPVNEITLKEGESVQLVIKSDNENISDIGYVGFISLQYRTAVSQNLKLTGYRAGEDSVRLHIESSDESYINETYIKVNVLPSNSVSSETRDRIEKLSENEIYDYLRRKVELSGALSETQKRLNVDKVKEILDSARTFNDIRRQLDEYHGFPDLIPGNSGSIHYIYWFDNYGNEYIDLNFGSRTVYYGINDEYGFLVAGQILYPEKNAGELNNYETKYKTDWYEIYNKIDNNGEDLNQDVALGDINSDGVVDLTDLTELSLYLIGDSELTAAQQKVADVDGDGEVKLADLAMFRQFLSKQISSLG